MAPSAVEARALEQVKMGLAILYGTSYFTEDEWIKIDALIRKKQYGSTPKPSCHILDDDEPLISFPDSKHNADVNIQDTRVFPSKTFEKDAIVISEKEIQLPVCPESAAPTQSPAEDPIGPLTETRSNTGDTLLEPTAPARQPPQPEHAETLSSDDTSPAEKLPRDFARDPFDEVMRLEEVSTKEGYSSYSEHASTENSRGETHAPDLANSSERELWTHSSVTDVDSDDIASSTQSNNWNQPYSNLPAADIIRTNDKPRTIDNSYKANKFTRTTKSLADSLFAHDTSSGDDGPAPQLEVTPGTILVAQISFPKTTTVHVDVCSGDSVKVIKKVSGIMYHGQNMRTKLTGQFPSSIFQKSLRERKKYPAIEKLRAPAAPKTLALTRDTNLSSSSGGNDLDKVEDLNAAEWDKDDASVVTAPVIVNSSTWESVSGKYSTLANLDDQSQCSDAMQQEMIHAMMSKMLDEKLQKIQKAGKKATGGNRVSSCHSEARNPWTEPLKPVAPKTQICWFFATPNKECRFTAEECRDLHQFYPSAPGDSLNLRMGKPTWGAAVDLLTPSPDDSPPDPKGREKTCWNWANANCEYSPDSCRFLHKHVPAGVMPRPPDKKDYWKRGRKGAYVPAEGQDVSNGEWGDGNTDLMDQEAVEFAWVDNSTEKYKPPHVKALEEKEQMKSAEWW